MKTLNRKIEIINLSDIELSNIEIEDKISNIIKRHKPTSVFNADSGNESSKKHIYNFKEVL